MPSPELIINNYKLETKFLKDHVQHTVFHEGASQRGRRGVVVETWHRERELGRGGCGTVFLERSGEGGLRAVKEIVKDRHSMTKINYERELMAMAVLAKTREHDSLFVQFFGWYESDNYIHIAMEYISQGHLRHYLEVERSESEAKVVIRQILKGLVVIHQEGFAHRDLKPENILVVSKSPIWVKIGDFGLAKLAQTGTAFRTKGGTMRYAAPEVEIDRNSNTSEYTNAVDIWSVGCITHELLTKDPPFLGITAVVQYCSYPELPRGSMLMKNVSWKGIEFVERTLAYPPERRITAKKALDSEWLRPEGRGAAELETGESLIITPAVESGSYSHEYLSVGTSEHLVPISSNVTAIQRVVVVGVDFGTTYSALAWTSTAAPDQVTMIAGWPSSGMRSNHSVPSEISYREGNTSDPTWGYDIDPRARRLKWFKLLLETDDAHPHSEVPLPPGITAMDATRDFLSGLYRHAIDMLWKEVPSLMCISKVDFVMTVPAVWSDVAKQRMREAAAQAGFMNEHDLTLLSEPEAAAIYSITRQTTNAINVNDRIVVCDAGEATVDLISYDVLSIYPNVRVTECTEGTGDFCGSTYIDSNFEELIKARLGTRYSSMTVETQRRIFGNFEQVKRAFGDLEGESTYRVSVPTIDTIQEAGIYDGEMHVTREEMRALFDPVVDQILVLISGQLQAISREGHRASSVLLIGIFSESPYLYARVKEWTDRWGVTIVQPREAATAVAMGAALRGIESSLGPSQQINVARRARRHYGITGQHDESDAYIGPETNEKMAGDQISWFLRKGESIPGERPITFNFCHFRRHTGPWVDTLTMVSCDLEIPPTRMTSDVELVCNINTDLSNISKSNYEKKWRNWKRFYIVRYNLDLSILSGEMKFEFVFKGRPYGTVKIDYEL